MELFVFPNCRVKLQEATWVKPQPESPDKAYGGCRVSPVDWRLEGGIYLGGGKETKGHIRGSNLARRHTLGARLEDACLLTLQGPFRKGRWPGCSILAANIYILLLFCLIIFCFRVTSAKSLSRRASTLTFAILDFFFSFCSDSGRAAHCFCFLHSHIYCTSKDAFPGALRLS